MAKAYYIAVSDTGTIVRAKRAVSLLHKRALEQMGEYLIWLMQNPHVRKCVDGSIVLKFSEKQRKALASYQPGNGRFSPFIRFNMTDFDEIVNGDGYEAAMDRLRESLKHELVHAYEDKVIGKMSPHKGNKCSGKCASRCPNFVEGATILFGQVRCRGRQVGNGEPEKLGKAVM